MPTEREPLSAKPRSEGEARAVFDQIVLHRSVHTDVR